MDNNQNQQPNGYGMPQPNMQAGMPGQTPQPGYGMPGQNVQPGYGMPQQPAGGSAAHRIAAAFPRKAKEKENRTDRRLDHFSGSIDRWRHLRIYEVWQEGWKRKQ